MCRPEVPVFWRGSEACLPRCRWSSASPARRSRDAGCRAPRTATRRRLCRPTLVTPTQYAIAGTTAYTSRGVGGGEGDFAPIWRDLRSLSTAEGRARRRQDGQHIGPRGGRPPGCARDDNGQGRQSKGRHDPACPLATPCQRRRHRHDAARRLGADSLEEQPHVVRGGPAVLGFLRQTRREHTRECRRRGGHRRYIGVQDRADDAGLARRVEGAPARRPSRTG